MPPARVAAIIRRRVPEAAGWLAQRVAVAVQRLRSLDLTKPPGIAEAINWANAMHVLGVSTMDTEAVERTLGAVLSTPRTPTRAHGRPVGAGQ